jgi:hypothetical protein
MKTTQEKIDMYREFAATRAPGIDTVVMPLDDLAALADDADELARFREGLDDALDTIMVRSDAAEEPIRHVLETLRDNPAGIVGALQAALDGAK